MGRTLLAREIWRVSWSDDTREKREAKICSEFSYGGDGDEEQGVLLELIHMSRVAVFTKSIRFGPNYLLGLKPLRPNYQIRLKSQRPNHQIGLKTCVMMFSYEPKQVKFSSNYEYRSKKLVRYDCMNIWNRALKKKMACIMYCHC